MQASEQQKERKCFYDYLIKEEDEGEADWIWRVMGGGVEAADATDRGRTNARAPPILPT
jgi:hypothetical protein